MIAESPPNASSRVFKNVLRLDDDMPPTAAEWVLKLGFRESDHARVADLAARNNEGKLTEAERREFEKYVHLNNMIATLQSKARLALTVSVQES